MVNKIVPGLGSVLQTTGDALTSLFIPQSDIDAENARAAADAASRAKVAADYQDAMERAKTDPTASLRYQLGVPYDAPKSALADAVFAGLGKPRFGGARYFDDC